MKRVKAACICQTLHFMLKDGVATDIGAKRTQYRILEETLQPDGSVIIKIIKQYNQSPVGDYLN